MKCKICGSEIRPGDTVCHVCGVIIDYHDYVNDPYDTYGNQDNNNNYDNNYNNYNNNNPLPPTDNDNFTFFSNTNKSSNKNNGDKTKYLIAAIVAVVLLIGCGVLLVKVLSPEPKAVEGDDDIILGDGGDSGKNTESPELPTTPTEPQDTYESFEGYKFKVANGYTVHQEQESLIFENKTEQFEFVLSIYHSNPYDIYVQRKDEVKQQWVDRGYVVNEYGEKQVENTNWLVLSSVYNGKPFSIVYRGFFNNSTLELLILNSGSLTNEQVYSKIELMLSSTEIDASPSGTNTNA